MTPRSIIAGPIHPTAQRPILVDQAHLPPPARQRSFCHARHHPTTGRTPNPPPLPSPHPTLDRLEPRPRRHEKVIRLEFQLPRHLQAVIQQPHPGKPPIRPQRKFEPSLFHQPRKPKRRQLEATTDLNRDTMLEAPNRAPSESASPSRIPRTEPPSPPVATRRSPASRSAGSP